MAKGTPSLWLDMPNFFANTQLPVNGAASVSRSLAGFFFQVTAAAFTKCAATFRRLGRMSSLRRSSERLTRRFRRRFTSGEGGPCPPFSCRSVFNHWIPDAGFCRISFSASMRLRHSGAPAPLPARALRCGRRRLGSRAHGRLWRFVARAQPIARIAPFRRLRSRHRRPCRAPTGADSFLHSWPVACTPLPHLRAEPARTETGNEKSARLRLP